MRKIISSMLVLLMFIGVPVTAFGASNLSTEQKFEVLKQKNIFTGFADGSSRLYDSMSREQLAAVLSRLLELPAQNSSPSYDDVLKTRWSYGEIQMVTRAGLMNGTKARIFSPEKNVTVEQLAAIFIRSYGLTGGGVTPVTGKVSKWARGAVSWALDRKLIPQLSDYTVDATRGLLVDAAYAIYEDTHVEPLYIRSVEQLSNQSARVNLLQWTNQTDHIADKGRFTLKDVYGNIRVIHQATLSQDGMSIVLWTDRQIGGVLHLITVDGNTWSYMSAPDDTTKPQVVSQPVKLPNRAYEITFSEPVELNSATNSSNYQLSHGLKLTTLQLSQDQRKVTFTTSEQSDGRNYQLTIRNVKDLAGNAMDTRNDLYLVGSNDNSKPKVTEAKIDANTALITVKFNEKIDPEHAAQTYHYVIDKGLAVTHAILENDGRTVTLRTTPQQDATLYSLTVSGIPDIAGNVMDTFANWKFGAVANPVVQAKLQSVIAVNKNTIEVTFNRALSESDARNVRLASLTDNGPGVSMSDWKGFVQWKPGSDRAFTIQYSNKSGNPDLFRAGHAYVARVTGVSGLDTSNNSDQAAFAGTIVDNANPFVTQVVVLDRKSVKVIFSEPVKNVNETAFYIRMKDGGEIKIGYDELNDKGRIVSEVVLKLNDELQTGKNYGMSFLPDIITDAAQWNGLKTKDGDQPYVVYFNT